MFYVNFEDHITDAMKTLTKDSVEDTAVKLEAYQLLGAEGMSLASNVLTHQLNSCSAILGVTQTVTLLKGKVKDAILKDSISSKGLDAMFSWWL